MAKVYMKGELFHKEMTLAKLQAIATTLEMPYNPTDSKEKIANGILTFQREKMLTEGSDDSVGAEPVAVAAAEEPAKEEQPVTLHPSVIVKMLDELGVPSLKALVESLKDTMGELEKSLVDRIRTLEHTVEKLVAGAKDAVTLHGHIDNLAKPGLIDDLPKLSELKKVV